MARMLVGRFFTLLMVVAVAASGCARRPVAQVPVATAPGLAPQGIDSVVYGAQRGPVVVAQPMPVAVGGPLVAPVAMPAAYSALGDEGPYTLDSGDRLRIVVFGQEGLTNSYAVDAGGHITMPLIGSVEARGLTTEELSRLIADKLRQGYIREPHVAVEIEAYRPFFILGEVTAPGQYPYVANMTVETAVAIAGGFGPRGFRKTVTISRTISGQQMRMTVPITCPIRPGDTINVQERWF